LVATISEQVFHDGELVLLADQDHSLLDTAEIAQGREALDRALALVHDPAERRLLQRRLAELDTAAGR
jgi:predicted RNA polymerase sigma factor